MPGAGGAPPPAGATLAADDLVRHGHASIYGRRPVSLRRVRPHSPRPPARKVSRSARRRLTSRHRTSYPPSRWRLDPIVRASIARPAISNTKGAPGACGDSARNVRRSFSRPKSLMSDSTRWLAFTSRPSPTPRHRLPRFAHVGTTFDVLTLVLRLLTLYQGPVRPWPNRHGSRHARGPG